MGVNLSVEGGPHHLGKGEGASLGGRICGEHLTIICQRVFVCACANKGSVHKVGCKLLLPSDAWICVVFGATTAQMGYPRIWTRSIYLDGDLFLYMWDCF